MKGEELWRLACLLLAGAEWEFLKLPETNNQTSLP
jgi:hypothetical protein